MTQKFHTFRSLAISAAISLALIAWAVTMDAALRYQWEYSCTTDTECVDEDAVRDAAERSAR